MKRYLFIASLLVLSLLVIGRPSVAATLNVTIVADSSSVQVGQTVGVTVTTRDSSSNLTSASNVIVEAKSSTGQIVSSTAPRDTTGTLTVAFGPISTVGSYTLQADIGGTKYPGPALSVVAAFGPQPQTTNTPAATQSSQVVGLPNPIACNDATCLIGQVVRYILGTIAVIATLMFVWGGVMMLTSGGNADQVKRAKETLTWATIGVIVILLSWVIIKAVLQALTKTA